MIGCVVVSELCLLMYSLMNQVGGRGWNQR